MNDESIKRCIPLVKALMKHAVIVSNGLNEKVMLGEHIVITLQEWLVVELIVEQSYEYNSMHELSRKIGIPPSTFSRIVNHLEKVGLIDKYRIHNNKKNIILRPSEQALTFYRERTTGVGEEIWGEFYKALDHFSDRDIYILTDAIQKLNERLPSARYSQDIELIKED